MVLSLVLLCIKYVTSLAVSGAEHGGDPDTAGLCVLCEAVGVCEEQRILRVHQTSDRQIPYLGVWKV